ncbi:hypothetical protein C0J52_15549 [Blattella germanica]|nr:hypothetical protein C0J52_15549 [Blattella germanica]
MEPSTRKKSFIWKYFKEVSAGRAKCEICSGVYSFKAGTTSNLTRHLQNKHPTAAIKPDELQIAAEDPDEPTASTSTSSDGPSTGISSEPPAKVQRSQRAITEFVSRPVTVQKSKTLDNLLLKLIVKQYHSFRLVEQNEFKELLHNLNPNYAIPSRKTLSNALLDATYENVKTKVKDTLTQAVACCLTTDSWTLGNNEKNMYIFNASRQTENRTTKQLKELYFVLKRNARKLNNEDKMGHLQTGGGQFTPKSDNIDLEIVGALKDQFEPDENRFDSSAIMYDEIVPVVNDTDTPEASCVCIITEEPHSEIVTLPEDAATSSDIAPPPFKICPPGLKENLHWI